MSSFRVIMVWLNGKIAKCTQNIKNEFAVELSSYIYDNSMFNQLFPLFLFAYALFFAFVGIHCFFEWKKIYESDLELAEIEQRLIKYFSKPPLAKLFMFLNIEATIKSDAIKYLALGYEYAKVDDLCDEVIVLKKRRRWINWPTWRLYYVIYEKIFGKKEVDVLMKIIRRKWKLDVLDKINGPSQR